MVFEFRQPRFVRWPRVSNDRSLFPNGAWASNRTPGNRNADLVLDMSSTSSAARRFTRELDGLGILVFLVGLFPSMLFRSVETITGADARQNLLTKETARTSAAHVASILSDSSNSLGNRTQEKQL